MEDLLNDLEIPTDPFNCDAILKSYDLNKPPSENIKTISNSNQRDPIVATVNYIKTLKEKYPTIADRIIQRNSRNKQNWAGDISIFVNGIIPMSCQACNSDYCQADAVNTEGNTVTCFLCNRFSHKACYSNQEDTPKGLFFICAICVETANQGSDNSLDNILSQSQIPSSQERLDEGPLSQHNTTHDSDAVEVQDDTGHEVPDIPPDGIRNTRRDTRKNCPLYLENICPHGISGRGCNFKHPKRCFKYSSYGEDQQDGCTRGRRCWFFHPRLCQNSIQMGMCLNKSCKDIHLLETKRKPKKNQNLTSESRYNQRSEQHQQPRDNQNQPTPWTQPQVNQLNTQPQVDNTRSEDFLVKYLEKMKAELSKSMDERLGRIESAFQSRVVVRENPQHMIHQQLTPQVVQPNQNSQPTPQEAYHHMQQHPGSQYPPQMVPVMMNQVAQR